MKKNTLQAPRGMHDVLPADQAYWSFVLKKAKNILEDYGFETIETPVMESAALYQRSVGEATDIIEKEIYILKTKGGDALALRPEFTAGIVRAYIENGMHVLPHPVQLWSYGPVFRHDNPQAGRLRQFHQINVESFGNESSATDSVLIFMAYRILESMGLKNITVRINSLGDADCRPQYLKVLKEYFKGKEKKLCSACQQRLKTNILRVLDCAENECRQSTADAPQMVDHLDENCKKHFREVVEFLDEMKVPYLLDHRLVRGLDYYTRTVFEIWPDSKEKVTAQGALCAGGRYDKLVQLLGGPKTPACGWALGVERAILQLKEMEISIPDTKTQPKIFIAQLGELAKRKSLMLFEEFRRAGILARASFGRDSIKSQLKIANRLGIKYTLIIGQKEALDGTIILREMTAGVQETIPIERVVETVKHKLKG